MDKWIEWDEKVRTRLEHCLLRYGASTPHTSDIRAALTRIRTLEIAVENAQAALDGELPTSDEDSD
jgi:hypothetical protein